MILWANTVRPYKKYANYYNYFKIGFSKGAFFLWQGARGTVYPDMVIFISQKVYSSGTKKSGDKIPRFFNSM